MAGLGPPDSASFAFDVLRTDAELGSLEDEWLDLWLRSKTQDPFAHPGWVTAWLRHFVADHSIRRVVTARSEGQLVAVAPFYLHTYGRRPIKGRCLQLIGGGGGHGEDPLTEMGEILIGADDWRKVMREVIHFVAAELEADFDWLGLALTPQQGWFDNRWVPETWRRAGSIGIHKECRPLVVLPLPSDWAELRLKRNMKEAIRRAKNRIAAVDPSAEARFVSGDAAPAALEEVYELHRRRSEARGHVLHRDDLHESLRRFATDAVSGLARTGHASVGLLSVNGSSIAGRVVLTADNTSYLSLSGLDPEHWKLGGGTFLISAAIRNAIDRQAELFNLSAYPDDAKLRWSEQCQYQNQFVVVCPRRSSRRAFELYWLMRAHRFAKFESALHRDALEGE